MSSSGQVPGDLAGQTLELTIMGLAAAGPSSRHSPLSRRADAG